MPLRAVFNLSDATHGDELWITDGTDAGTRLLADLAPGTADSSPSYFQTFGNQVLFQAFVAGQEKLFVTNGSAGGTHQIASGNGITPLGTLGGEVLFWSTNFTTTATPPYADLYATDAAGSSPTLLHHFTTGASPTGVRVGNKLYFENTDPAHGYELWSTDGTAAGTVLARDTNPGTGDGGISDIAAINGVAYYLAQVGSNTVLGRADTGTVATVSTLKTQTQGFFDGTVGNLTVFDIAAINGTTFAYDGDDVWATNGTAAGTVKIASFGSGVTLSSTLLASPLSGHALFLVSSTSGGGFNPTSEDLWTTDGTAAGTSLIAHLFSPATGTGTQDVDGTAVLNGKAYFGVSDGTTTTLWSSDGISAAPVTTVIADGALQLQDFITLGDHVLFSTGFAVGFGDASADASLQGLWSTDGTAAGTVHIGPAAGTDFSVLALLPIGLTDHDLDGNAKADLLWSSTDGNVLYDFAMNGTAFTASPIAGAGSAWAIKAVVDFDGDGRSDILWQNSAGAIWSWTMHGASFVSAQAVGDVGTAWSIQGTGDFNGDSRGDILFRNADGLLYLWEMNGTTIAAQGTPGILSNAWSVSGIADFNGDGLSDILFRNTDGTAWIWQMNGTQVAAQGPAGFKDSSWTVAGLADFNGDGKADILWHGADGTLELWQMNGTTLTAATWVANVGTDWQVRQLGDVTGDGKADILLQNGAGLLWLFQMDGASIVGGGAVATVDPASWHLN